ncbi:MAG: DUF309 domain-containing protein [Acidobacteriia bacterium]|mgnify:FL=1|nr:DUF309 domain-containing protein [Terriglobia bacterium]
MLSTKRSFPPSEFIKGVDLFNRQFYYECHDVWEEIWSEAKGKEKIFYQALIMSAVSLYHFGNENIEGALSCYQKGLERFGQLPDHFLQFNIKEFVEQMERFYSNIPTKKNLLTQDLLNKSRPKIQMEHSFFEKLM